MSSILNLNDSSPAAPTGYQNAKWQRGSSPAGTDSTTGLPYYDASDAVPNTGGVSVKTADYTLAAGDCGRLVVLNSASAHTFTLPATPPSVGTNQWQVSIANVGAGVLTLAVTSAALLDGVATSVTLATNTGLKISTDGTNYFTERGAASKAVHKVVMVVDGGGSVPATGAVKRFGQVDFNGTILGWAAFGDASGSATVDVWKKAGTAPPTATAPVVPTSSDKISASAPVAISAAQSAAGGASAISTWTTAVTAGDTFGFSIASISTIVALTVEIYIQQS